MLNALFSELSELERRVVAPLGQLSNLSDTEAAGAQEVRGFLIFRFASKAGTHCPFEVHFGRREYLGKFNFYIGAGAEFCSFESLVTLEDAAELAQDLRLFLQSNVRCDRSSLKGRVVREVYVVEKLSAGGAPLKLVHDTGGALLPFLAKRESFEYSPWLAENGREGEGSVLS